MVLRTEKKAQHWLKKTPRKMVRYIFVKSITAPDMRTNRTEKPNLR